jgi:hypothetical protein
VIYSFNIYKHEPEQIYLNVKHVDDWSKRRTELKTATTTLTATWSSVFSGTAKITLISVTAFESKSSDAPTNGCVSLKALCGSYFVCVEFGNAEDAQEVRGTKPTDC